MRGIKPIFFNELKLYLFSWLGWTSLIVINIFAGISFLTIVEYGNFNRFFDLLEIPFVWAILIVGARSLSRDRDLGLFSLFFTAPITLNNVVFGKFFALVAFFFISAASLFFYPMMISFFFPISWITMFSGFFALSLVILLFSAVSLFASSFSSNTLIAILIGFGIWMLMNIIQSISGILDPGSSLMQIMSAFSYGYHFKNINSGVFSLDDIFYFILQAFIFIELTESRILVQIAR